MGGDDSLRIFELTPVVHVGASMAGTLLEERRGGRFRIAEGGFHMDRGALVFGASLGLTLDFGRILMRPRLDVFTGQARESAEEMPMASDVPDHRFGGTMTVITAARPQLLLFTVDVGWSFRPRVLSPPRSRGRSATSAVRPSGEEKAPRVCRD